MGEENINQNSFAQKVVWITGASAGIGEAMAVAFAASGAKLVLSARNNVELERVKARCLEAGADQQEVLVLTLDVVDVDASPPASPPAALSPCPPPRGVTRTIARREPAAARRGCGRVGGGGAAGCARAG